MADTVTETQWTHYSQWGLVYIFLFLERNVFSENRNPDSSVDSVSGWLQLILYKTFLNRLAAIFNDLF